MKYFKQILAENFAERGEGRRQAPVKTDNKAMRNFTQ